MFASVSPSAFSFLFIVVLFALAFTAANNDINVLSQTELDHCVTEPTKLVLHNVTLLDAGIYMCHAINNIGDVNSSAVLTVLPATANSGQFLFCDAVYTVVAYVWRSYNARQRCYGSVPIRSRH